MKRFSYVFVFAVSALLLVPALLFLFGARDGASGGAKAFAPAVVRGGRFNERFLSDFGEWFGSSFPLRSYLIEAFNTADAALLSDVNTKEAIVGKDGFIFFGETAADYLGTDTLSREELSSIVDYLGDIEALARENGAVFVFVTAPNKASVYPELMPSYLKRTGGASNIDLLTEMLLESGVTVFDAKSALLSGKAERSVYYEHDSHWNNFGAALVYNGLADIAGLESFDPRVYDTVFDRTGDLHRFVHPVTDHFEERIVYPELRDWSSKRPVDFDRDKVIETFSDANGMTVLMFHDSFGRSLQPFFSQTSGRLVVNAYFPYDLSLVSELAPDVVIIELVERNLPLLAEYAALQGY